VNIHVYASGKISMLGYDQYICNDKLTFLTILQIDIMAHISFNTFGVKTTQIAKRKG